MAVWYMSCDNDYIINLIISGWEAKLATLMRVYKPLQANSKISTIAARLCNITSQKRLHTIFNAMFTLNTTRTLR